MFAKQLDREDNNLPITIDFKNKEDYLDYQLETLKLMRELSPSLNLPFSLLTPEENEELKVSDKEWNAYDDVNKMQKTLFSRIENSSSSKSEKLTGELSTYEYCDLVTKMLYLKCQKQWHEAKRNDILYKLALSTVEVLVEAYSKKDDESFRAAVEQLISYCEEQRDEEAARSLKKSLCGLCHEEMTAAAIGKLIDAHNGGKEDEFNKWIDHLATMYDKWGKDIPAEIIRKRLAEGK